MFSCVPLTSPPCPPDNSLCLKAVLHQALLKYSILFCKNCKHWSPNTVLPAPLAEENEQGSTAWQQSGGRLLWIQMKPSAQRKALTRLGKDAAKASESRRAWTLCTEARSVGTWWARPLHAGLAGVLLGARCGRREEKAPFPGCALPAPNAA